MNFFPIAAIIVCTIQINNVVNSQSVGRTNLLEISIYDNCQGKDSANYTLFDQWTLDLACTPTSVQLEPAQELVAYAKDGTAAVNVLKVLATSINPNGQFFELEILYLAESGPLAGKILFKQKQLENPAYLKKCSSVLGRSFDTTDGSQIFITDQIDFSVLLSPTGGLDAFNRLANSPGSAPLTTHCTGVGYTF